MNVLVIGSGGREHALIWKIVQSPWVKKVFCAPGNAGISKLAECIDIKAEDIKGLRNFALKNQVDLTIVGPEGPLVAGIVDLFSASKLPVFGPRKKAAALEGSKVFAKRLMIKYGIPTADYRIFQSPDKALSFLKKTKFPVVVKAEGLAAGKGVIIAKDYDMAADAIQTIMVKEIFGNAGKRVLVEEFLEGEEVSFMAVTDGKTLLPLATSQDHKAIYDGDKGPNTGGMGAYSPAPIVDANLEKEIVSTILQPAIRAMAEEGKPYMGILYAGLIINQGKPKVLEFNCRLGDPETQPVMVRMKSDLVELVQAAIDGNLQNISVEWDTRPAVCVVMASGGYPGSYRAGEVISGIETASRMENVTIFHGGTSLKGDLLVTSGGRVLGVTALGYDIGAAVKQAYSAVKEIKWQGAYYRKDIGHRALDKKGKRPLVGIVMGSDSDLPVMSEAASILKSMGIPYEITVSSAHRAPARTHDWAKNAHNRGIEVIIAGAGAAAHLAGVIAAETTLPVIGVPINSSALNGLDSLLSTVQMPPGVPVATMAIGKAGAKNAGIFAVQVLSLKYPDLAKKLSQYKARMAQEVEEKAKRLCPL